MEKNLKGFKQVTLSYYNGLEDNEKKGYMWLVRTFSGDTVTHSSIYFGTRLYAEVNNDEKEDEKIANIIETLGSMVDAEGKWVGFSPLEDHPILAETGVTDAAEALTALETAILDEVSARESAITATNTALSAETEAREAAITAVEGELSAETAARESAITATNAALSAETEAREAAITTVEGELSAETEERISADTYLTEVLRAEIAERISSLSAETEARISADTAILEYVNKKVAGLWHFKGVVDKIADLPTSGNNEGDVYHVKENSSEFVWTLKDGEGKWIELGSIIDLSNYYTKSQVNEIASGLNDSIISMGETLEGEIEEEAAIRASAITATNAALSAETEARISAITATNAALSAETEARETAIETVEEELSANTAYLQSEIDVLDQAHIISGDDVEG